MTLRKAEVSGRRHHLPSVLTGNISVVFSCKHSACPWHSKHTFLRTNSTADASRPRTYSKASLKALVFQLSASCLSPLLPTPSISHRGRQEPGVRLLVQKVQRSILTPSLVVEYSTPMNMYSDTSTRHHEPRTACSALRKLL